MTPINTPPLSSDKQKMLDRLRAAIQLRHDSIRTKEAYVQWARRFILFHGKRHPEETGPSEIEAFLTHLAVERKVSSSTQNQAFNAIAFLYKEAVKREMGTLGKIVRAKKSERVPLVFSPQASNRGAGLGS